MIKLLDYYKMYDMDFVTKAPASVTEATKFILQKMIPFKNGLVKIK